MDNTKAARHKPDHPPAASILLNVYNQLYNHFGPQQWWPAESPVEVIVGAVLTQNTAWVNVEKALAALREKNLLSVEALFNIPENTLAALIRPSGFFNLKARRLKVLVTFIVEAVGKPQKVL